MLCDNVLAELIPQPQFFDRRIRRGDRHRQQRTDDSAELGSDRERYQHGDVAQSQSSTVDLRADEVVLELLRSLVNRLRRATQVVGRVDDRNV